MILIVSEPFFGRISRENMCIKSARYDITKLRHDFREKKFVQRIRNFDCFGTILENHSKMRVEMEFEKESRRNGNGVRGVWGKKREGPGRDLVWGGVDRCLIDSDSSSACKISTHFGMHTVGKLHFTRT